MAIIDFYLLQDNQADFDLVVDPAIKDFKSVSGFDTAYLFQLFIDKRSTKNECSNPRTRQGWIGDIQTKQNNYEVGSFVYLKNQSRNTQNDQNELVAYAKDGLRYFVQIGAAQKVNASILGNNINGEIIIDNNLSNKFKALWQNVGK